MLVVKIELWPGGYPDNKKEIAEMKIGNISNLADDSDYVALCTESASKFNDHKALNTKIIVEKHNRYQSVYALIEKIARIAKLGNKND